VKLTGHVASAAQKQKAGEVVQGLDGVTTVENDLAIGGAEK
jgi:osmotically-inducible protein OsmY